MEKIAFTTNLQREQVEKLRAIAKATHIPQSVLLREWVEKGIAEITKSKDFVKNEDFFTKESDVKGVLSRSDVYKER